MANRFCKNSIRRVTHPPPPDDPIAPPEPPEGPGDDPIDDLEDDLGSVQDDVDNIRDDVDNLQEEESEIDPTEIVQDGLPDVSETWDEVSRETSTRDVDGITVEDTVSITFRRSGGSGTVTLNFQQQ